MTSETTESRRRFLATGVLGAAGVLAPQRRPSPPQTMPGAPDSDDDAAWSAVREAFLLEPGIAYMNNASLGMPPGLIATAVGRGYEAISREPLHGKHELQESIAKQVLPALGRFFGAEPAEISLTRNATEALHVAAASLRLAPGDEVITTSQEHPAGIRPWHYLAERQELVVHEVLVPSPLAGVDDLIARFEAALTPRTRALACCHVTRGGHLYPVASIIDWAHDRGLTVLIDGAQAVGMEPVDLHALGCDAYSASLHKWMLGPIGTGFLYLRAGARDRFRSTVDREAPGGSPGYVIGGTVDLPLRAALGTAVEFVTAMGITNVARRCRHLSDQLKRGLATINGVTVLSGAPEWSAPGSTIFSAEGVDPFAAVPWFEHNASIHIDEHVRDGHQAIRVSTHVYNTSAEIERFLQALRRAMHTRVG